jgi:hypothetical protein
MPTRPTRLNVASPASSSTTRRCPRRARNPLSLGPGRVFDLTLPLNQVAEGYRAMDERRAIKALLIPERA